eukprot:TRINITY_DN384_c0_g1_i5.p1 TRINITY_DN384_c0_g1~~TRINITY_DN384_c0_g1_i5.p1  ORF type:complete len:618 (-),score=152.29 TRINITY_DN384_c0_g1_i5:1859-3712(-)
MNRMRRFLGRLWRREERESNFSALAVTEEDVSSTVDVLVVGSSLFSRLLAYYLQHVHSLSVRVVCNKHTRPSDDADAHFCLSARAMEDLRFVSPALAADVIPLSNPASSIRVAAKMPFRKTPIGGYAPMTSAKSYFPVISTVKTTDFTRLLQLPTSVWLSGSSVRVGLHGSSPHFVYTGIYGDDGEVIEMVRSKCLVVSNWDESDRGERQNRKQLDARARLVSVTRESSEENSSASRLEDWELPAWIKGKATGPSMWTLFSRGGNAILLPTGNKNMWVAYSHSTDLISVDWMGYTAKEKRADDAYHPHIASNDHRLHLERNMSSRIWDCRELMSDGLYSVDSAIQHSLHLGWRVAGICKGFYGLSATHSSWKRESARIMRDFQKRSKEWMKLKTAKFPLMQSYQINSFMQRLWTKSRLSDLIDSISSDSFTVAMSWKRKTHEVSSYILGRMFGSSVEEIVMGSATPCRVGERMDGRNVFDLGERSISSIMKDDPRYILLLLMGNDSKVDKKSLKKRKRRLHSLCKKLDEKLEDVVETFVVLPPSLPLSEVSEEDRYAILDTEKDLHREFALSKPRAVLIRPDGYVAMDTTKHIDEVSLSRKISYYIGKKGSNVYSKT